MSDLEFDALAQRLRASAAVWFNNAGLMDLESLITEAERLRLHLAALITNADLEEAENVGK